MKKKKVKKTVKYHAEYSDGYETIIEGADYYDVYKKASERAKELSLQMVLTLK